MHPVVHATTRTPGPSTAEPVVNEWRNPMSPVASALRTSDSARPAPRLTRSAKGRGASSAGCAAVSGSDTGGSAVERPIDDVHLLFAREPHEIDGIARHA